MRITLDKHDVKIIEQIAIERAFCKAARAAKMNPIMFKQQHKVSSIAWHDGLCTVEFEAIPQKGAVTEQIRKQLTRHDFTGNTGLAVCE